mgnify:CR=1 FL=1|tara:strand:+ start:688 stop:1035 length:348 start_codon:yes stop_codon:yes gene_type:complete
MNKGYIIFYASIFLLLLLPNTFGKFIFNLAGSLLILGILVPIFFSIAAWLGIRVLKSKLIRCSSCGTTFFSSVEKCPACGSTDLKKFLNDENKMEDSNIPASDVTIDIIPEENSE